MNLSGLRIVVTGAAGFIGSHLSDRLAEDNELVLVDDFSVGHRSNLAQLEGHSDIEIVEADVCDRERMRALCSGADVVFHLACSCLRTSLGNPFESHDVNGGGTLSVCLAAHDAGVSRLVYVSSSEIYGSAQTVPMAETHPCAPTTVYGASKLAGEHYALSCWRTYGLPAMVVRPFNTYGPREPASGARAEVIPRFALRLDAGQAPVIYGDGSQTRDFTFVEDTVRGLVAAAACDELVGDTINIAFGREASIVRIAELLAEMTNNSGLIPLFAEPRPGDVDRHFADVSKAKRLLGFEARIDLETGLARTLEWFRSNHSASSAEIEASGSPNW